MVVAPIGFVSDHVEVIWDLDHEARETCDELGVRMAMGASREQVFKLVLGQGGRLVAFGLAVGLAAAFGLTRLMQSLLFGVDAHDVTVYAGVTAALFAVAMAACYVPARRSARGSRASARAPWWSTTRCGRRPTRARTSRSAPRPPARVNT